MITFESLKPCKLYWTEEEIRAVLGDGKTPEEVAALNVRSLFRVCALLVALPERKQAAFAAACARRAGPTDPRSLAAIEATERYAAGGPPPSTSVRHGAWRARESAAERRAAAGDVEVRNAAEAAYATERYLTAAASLAAADAAAHAACACAAWHPEYAARAATYAADASPDDFAERQAQLAHLLELHA